MKKIVSLLLLLLLLAACDSGTPLTATVLPPTATPIVADESGLLTNTVTPPPATRTLAPDIAATISQPTSQPTSIVVVVPESTRLAEATAAEIAAATAVATARSGTTATLNQPLLSGAALVDEMRKGGLTIYIRHGERNAYDEPQLPDMNDCGTQNILTLVGIEQSKRVGVAYQTLGIPVGEVYSGQFCRNKDSAMLGFSKDTVLPELNRFDPQIVPTIRRLLSIPPAPGTNTLIVNHHGALAQAANIRLIAYSESAVFRPTRDGFQFLGYLTLEQIEQLAAAAVSP